MKKLKLIIVPLLLLVGVSSYGSGPITSSGAGQNLETCERVTEFGSIKLTVQVVNNSHLEASLEDTEELDRVLVIKDRVFLNENGVFISQSSKDDSDFKISFNYDQGIKYATVLVTSNTDQVLEPRVYINLECVQSFK